MVDSSDAAGDTAATAADTNVENGGADAAGARLQLV